LQLSVLLLRGTSPCLRSSTFGWSTQNGRAIITIYGASQAGGADIKEIYRRQSSQRPFKTYDAVGFNSLGGACSRRSSRVSYHSYGDCDKDNLYKLSYCLRVCDSSTLCYSGYNTLASILKKNGYIQNIVYNNVSVLGTVSGNAGQTYTGRPFEIDLCSVALTCLYY
jgi:hypothetical protein